MNHVISELESNKSHSLSIHKSKKKKASNPTFQHLQHYMNTNFQPDFHGDGNLTIIYWFYNILIINFNILGSYPSPIPQYIPQAKSNKHITSNDAAQNVSKQYVYEGNINFIFLKYTSNFSLSCPMFNTLNRKLHIPRTVTSISYCITS